MALKVGIIGLGVGESHLETYITHPECEVVAICDLDHKRLGEIHKKYPRVPVASENAEQVLSDSNIQLVSIASYDNFHHEQISAAIRSGKHVFVEKPLVILPEHAAEVWKLLKQHPQTKLGSNLVLRRSPRFLELRSLIQAGKLGELYLIEGDYNYGRRSKITDGWRGDIPNYSPTHGGGVHIIDQMLWLTGSKVTAVSALGTNKCTVGSKYRANDTVVALLRFENGLIGKLSANLPCVYPHFHRLSVYGTIATWENGFENALLFESFDVKDRDSDTGQKNPPPIKLSSPYPGVHKGELLKNFIDAVTSNSTPEITAQEVFDVWSICNAIDEAARTGEWVEVTYFK